ncbi:hypothetical protein [Breznakiella homolactica]|uniref:Uncharacterized protein n=1 Tax=Breznakiella homolactica TaxID=2798577 RepID=A0A7T8BBZ9_9SPIR|nr:hypothetical protein [Breznakiella homolactica]QQO09723.1 hypothetical protein JFL75_02050 [Breznakiella homolactica]
MKRFLVVLLVFSLFIWGCDSSGGDEAVLYMPSNGLDIGTNGLFKAMAEFPALTDFYGKTVKRVSVQLSAETETYTYDLTGFTETTTGNYTKDSDSNVTWYTYKDSGETTAGWRDNTVTTASATSLQDALAKYPSFNTGNFENMVTEVTFTFQFDKDSLGYNPLPAEFTAYAAKLTNFTAQGEKYYQYETDDIQYTLVAYGWADNDLYIDIIVRYRGGDGEWSVAN